MTLVSCRNLNGLYMLYLCGKISHVTHKYSDTHINILPHTNRDITLSALKTIPDYNDEVWCVGLRIFFYVSIFYGKLFITLALAIPKCTYVMWILE